MSAEAERHQSNQQEQTIVSLSPILEHALAAWLIAQSRPQHSLEVKIDQILSKMETLLATEQQALEALAKIDAATTSAGVSLTAIGDNVNSLTTIATQVGTEVDALVAALQAAGVSQALIDQAVAVQAKAESFANASAGVSAATASLVPVMNAIASKGIINPVPIPVPPPVEPIPAV